jgi:Tfp pilus assembly protein PilV
MTEQLRRRRAIRPLRNRDGGNTLIEILIVISIMGVLATSLALVFTTVVRLAPAAEGRDDDSRSLLSLTAYMPEDVNSTPASDPNMPLPAAGGFNFDKNVSTGCAVTNPGVNLVKLTWQEVAGSTTTYNASYRYEDDGDGYRIMRYACLAGQPARPGAMSSILPPINEAAWTPGTGPVIVTAHLDSVTGLIDGVNIKINTVAGDEFQFEMRTNNLNEELAPIVPGGPGPAPITNQAPVAGPVTATSSWLGAAFSPLVIGLPAYDPDGDALTIALVDVPVGWTTSLSGLDVTIQPPPSSALGSYIFQYEARDPWLVTTAGDITVSLVLLPPGNTAPTTAPVVEALVAGTASTFALPVNDIDGDPLTITHDNVDASLTITQAGTALTIVSDGTNLNPAVFNYTVDDGTVSVSNTITLTVTIPVNTCSVSSLSPMNTSVEVHNKGYLKQDVKYTVVYTGSCTNLILLYDNDFSDSDPPKFLSFGAGNSVTVDGHNGGLDWTAGAHSMILQDGLTGSPILTATLNVT